ncbi:MAG: histidine--tRNA ligase [Candidatus Woesearchaeota archaeon]|nr:histidine--tRNA ligase [Candidatus Woesearchaeota archaeon]
MEELSRAKGTRDFLPEEKILRQSVENTLKKIFERYGFSPAETPILERYDVLASKYAGGEEILKETFKLKDQGDRELALRYDLTVPLARVVAMNPTLKMPFRRYQMGVVFRDGPLKAGRYREFTQCDVDVIGASSIKQDAEIINLTLDAFKAINIKAKVEVNNRKILDALMETAQIPEDKRTTAILSIDKLKKLGVEVVKKELQQKGIFTEPIDNLCKWISIKGTNEQKIKELKKILINKQGLLEMEEVLSYAPDATFEITLARGLAYYTGTVFEGFAEESTITSSIAGGGRYDNMIGLFKGSGSIPAVGISFGLDTILDVLKAQQKEIKKSVTQVFVLPIKVFPEAWKVAQELREAGINTEIDMLDRSVSKNFDYANVMGIPYVVVLGPEEVKEKKIKVKEMQSGKEEVTTIKQFIKNFKNK